MGNVMDGIMGCATVCGILVLATTVACLIAAILLGDEE